MTPGRQLVYTKKGNLKTAASAASSTERCHRSLCSLEHKGYHHCVLFTSGQRPLCDTDVFMARKEVPGCRGLPALQSVLVEICPGSGWPPSSGSKRRVGTNPERADLPTLAQPSPEHQLRPWLWGLTGSGGSLPRVTFLPSSRKRARTPVP